MDIGRWTKRFHHFRELLDVSSRAFKGAPAVEIGSPNWCLREGFGGVLIERLRHQGYQIADDSRVLQQRLDDCVGESRLLLIEVAGLVVIGHFYQPRIHAD